MATKTNESQDPLTWDIYGTKIDIPVNGTNIVLILVFLTQLVLLLKSKPVELALDLLRGSDLELLENLQDVAVELRELTKADRVLVVGFHNGKGNTVYHWKRLSALAESVRLGTEPIMNKYKDIDTISIISKSDYDLFEKLQAKKVFIHTHLDLPTLSVNQRRFILNCNMFGQYVLLLNDENVNLPHGAIFIQYDSREKCEVELGSTIGWSDATRQAAYDKAMIINNLIYSRSSSNFSIIKNKFINALKFW